MPDPQLQSTVQRMIDAGESEENIATVIQHYKSQQPKQTMSVMEMGRQSAASAGGEGGHPFSDSLNAMRESATIKPTDSKLGNLAQIVPYVLPSTPKLASEFIGRSYQALKSAAQDSNSVGRLVTLPLRAIGKFNQALPSQMAGDIERFHGGPPVQVQRPAVTINQAAPDVVDQSLRGFRPQSGPTPPHLDLSSPVSAGSLTQQQITERVAAVDAARAAGTPMPQHIQRGPGGRPVNGRGVLGTQKPAETPATISPAGRPSDVPAPPADHLPSPATQAPQTKSPQQALNEEALARRRQAYLDQLQGEAQQAPATTAKPSMNAAEVKEYQRLRAMGKTDAEAQAVMEASRAMNQQFGLDVPDIAATRFSKGMRGKVREKPPLR